MRHVFGWTLALGLMAGSLSAAGSDPAQPTRAKAPGAARPDPVAVCWKGFEPSGWEKLTQCLQAALKREEAALAERLAAVGKAGEKSMDKLSFDKTLEESNVQWAKYRDAECDRELAAVMGRNHPDIGELTCRLRLTTARLADLHFDD